MSTAAFFADSDSDNEEEEEEAAAVVKDDLADYLALPQINYTRRRRTPRIGGSSTAPNFLIWKLWRASTSVAPRPLPL